MRALAIDARYRVVRNIIRLPTFEVSETGGWAAYANTTIAVSTAEHYSGTSSLAITSTTLNGGVAGNITGVPSAPDYFYGFAGMEYAALWVKAPAGARMRLLLEERKPTSPWDLVGTLAQTLWTASGSWEVARVARQKSNGANIQRIGIQMSDRTGTFYIDDVAQFVVPATMPALAALDPLTGDSPNWQWDGTPGASTSRGWVFVP